MTSTISSSLLHGTKADASESSDSRSCTVTGRHATSDDERRARRDIGHARNLEDGLEAFLGSALDERARVHHHGIGDFGILLDDEAGNAEAAIACAGCPPRFSRNPW